MDHSSLSGLADAASDVLKAKKRLASNRVLSTCAQCHNSWPTALALEDHAKNAHHEAWVCSVAGCGVRFKNRSASSKHKSRHKNSDRGYPCLECGHVFPRRDNLFEHRAIQGRCKPSKSHGIAQCSSDRSKKRKLHDQIQSPSAFGVLNDSVPTAIVTPQQRQLLPPIEHGDHSWPQLPVGAGMDTSSRVTSVNHLPAWEHTYMPSDDQSSSGHIERASLGTETSNENDQLFYLTPGRFNAYSSSGHLILNHAGDGMRPDTTNNTVSCQRKYHAGGDMPNNHSILPDKANDVVSAISLPDYNLTDEGISSSVEPDSYVDRFPAESGVIQSQQDPPWLIWLRDRKEGLKLSNGYNRDLDFDLDLKLATRLQIVLELALLYYRDHLQDLRDIMSGLSITDLLQPIEQLKQAPPCLVYTEDIDRCRTALIPDLSTLCSFFGRDLAVGTGPHQALWSFAVWFGQNEMVELLLERGAHPDQEALSSNKSERIPLVVACNYEHWDLAKVLLKTGANPNVCNGDELSVLSVVVGNGDLGVVKLLLEKKADPNFNSESNFDIPLLVAIGRGCTDIVELLLQQGAEINIEGCECSLHGAKFRSHCTPLLLAITKEHIGIVNLLLKHGVDPAGQNAYYNPFIVAAGTGCTEVVELLLEKGADVNLKGRAPDFEEGRLSCSPLIYAIHNGHDNIAKLLLDKGADPSLSCEDGYLCPILIAVDSGRTNIVELLLDNGANVNMQGFDYGFWDGDLGCTPLILASHHGHIGMVKSLLRRGADANPNFDMEDGKHCSPLIEAVTGGHAEIVKLLLDNSAHINALAFAPMHSIEDEQQTPLCAAITGVWYRQEQSDMVVKLLLDNGADPNISPTGHLIGQTPLRMAVSLRKVDVVRLLLAKNARVEPGIEKEMVGCEHEDEYHIVLKLIEAARLRQALS